jgi:N-acetylglutamate synthase-like GNAT family acetyltransferase
MSKAIDPTNIGPSSNIILHHGSGSKFDRFDHGKMGSGEGNQSYGWGTYLAQHPDVAGGYQKRLSGNDKLDKLTANGEPIPFSIKGDISESAFINLLKNDGDVQKTLKELDDKAMNSPIQGIRTKSAKERDFLADFAKNNKLKFDKKGAFYDVDVPDEYLDDMIDYDLDIASQSDKVREVLLRLRKEFGTSFHDGQGAYYAIVFEMRRQGHKNPEKAASQYLDAQGIKGVKFLDQGSRNARYMLSTPETTKAGDWMVKDSMKPNSLGKHFDNEIDAQKFLDAKKKKTRNFVIFNEDNMKIIRIDGKDVNKNLNKVDDGVLGQFGNETKVKPLAMDETSRLSRAQEMGFDTDTIYYHGTTENGLKKINEEGFKVGKGGIQIGENIHLTPSKQYASAYGTRFHDFTNKTLPKIGQMVGKDKNLVIPVFIKKGAIQKSKFKGKEIEVKPEDIRPINSDFSPKMKINKVDDGVLGQTLKSTDTKTTIRSADGKAFITVDKIGDSMVVNSIHNAGKRGEGVGTALMKDAIADAENRGLKFTSSESISTDVERVYKRLEKEGYSIEFNKDTHIADNGKITSNDLTSPVVKVYPSDYRHPSEGLLRKTTKVDDGVLGQFGKTKGTFYTADELGKEALGYDDVNKFVTKAHQRQTFIKRSVAQSIADDLGGEYSRDVPIPEGITVIGDRGSRISVDGNNVYFHVASENAFGTDKIFLPNIAVANKSKGLGTKFMNAMKKFADKTSQDIVIYKITNKDFFRKFDWLEELDDGWEFEYKAKKGNKSFGLGELDDIWNKAHKVDDGEGLLKIKKKVTKPKNGLLD